MNSQLGQDLWALSTQGKTFCEVGAYDGITNSNTLLLEQSGWRGSLIEGHEPFFLECIKNRPNTPCYQGFVGPYLGEEDVWVGGQYTGLVAFMPRAWQIEHQKRNAQRYKVKIEPLIRFVRYVDYLSIDTEGGEYEILDSWFKAGGDCRALTVEFRYDADYSMKLERMLNDYGFVLDELLGFDACFLRR